MAANHINGPKEPYGYLLTATGLEPVKGQLEALDKALEYLKAGCSLQSTRNWLVKRTGRSISIIGLRKIWLTRQARQEENN